MDFIGDFMTTTKNELRNKKEMQADSPEEKTHYSESGKSLKSLETQKPSIQLSKDLAGSLMNLIEKVNQDGVTPETVNASCNAAAQIYKILRLNFEMKKEGF
jgi:hypothetical protein